MAQKPKTFNAITVSAFVNFVVSWKLEGKSPTAFRGQGYWDWPTEPRIFRKDIGLFDHENSAVRDLVSIHPQEFRSDSTMFDRLVRMQHFELPTRLLDVTSNPLVALWFAAQDFRNEDGDLEDGKVQAFFVPEYRQKYYDSDRVSCLANVANLKASEKKSLTAALGMNIDEFNIQESVKKLLYFVRMEKNHFEAKIEPGDLARPVYVKPKMSNRRIIAQSGAFIIFGARRPRITLGSSDLKSLFVLVPQDRKESVRAELELLGIHASTLFPEIDKASNFIVRRYQKTAGNDFSDLLG